jgi:hypothetical protein
MTRTESHPPVQRTGWVGWVFFAAILLLIGAAIDIFYGIMAIIGPNTAYFIGPNGKAAEFDVAGWGWWSLIIGLGLAFAAFALLTGRTWARILAVVIAGANAVSHLMSLPAQPWWSIVMVGIDILVIYAVTVHGKEVRA